MAFKRAITLDPNSTLANWEESGDVCNFAGVFCNKPKHRVVRLFLAECGLVGPLSPFLSNLTGLRKLLLYDNYFFGIIPSDFSNLRNLHFLQLDGNNLQGSIPESFALFSKLTLLMINDNNLTGTLPPSFFSNCTTLKNLDLSRNFFSGKIPQEIGNCPKLWNLNLYNNQFTGQLPESLINTSMASLDVEYNYLSGVLPSEIFGKLHTLEHLHLSFNNMSSHDNNTNLGPFFGALENCTKLTELELAGMGIGGTLPNSIGRLNLTNFLGNLVQVNSLFLNDNLLSGDFKNLESIDLSGNHLSGKIPVSLNKVHTLTFINFSFNEFEGMIPSGGIFEMEKVVDSSLVRASRDQFPEVKRMWDVAIGELIELGILCTQESPSTRPTMLDAADDLDRLKRYLSGDTTATFASSLGISSSTLGDD
ncbi:hypothetical protein Pint_30371 [Pistacia integerrima]|uniref:Uncharacterized protein n=1 Tax=Pistacia integerrima TaxID=434235 RepID=A0ACC0WYF8_9ROSI|nr:hypothetical protein Pint_30371 [Pistacia integerrima]